MNLLNSTLTAAIMGIGVIAQGLPALANDDLPTIKFGMIPVPIVPVFAAQAHGLFEKHGVNVEIIKFTSGPAQFQALQSESINLGQGALAAYYMSSTRGLNASWIYSIANFAPLEAIVLKPGSEVTKYEELADKKIAALSGSILHLSHLHAANLSGLTIDGSEMVSLPPPQALPALVKGDVEAAWFWEPFISKATEQGATVLSGSTDLGITDIMGIAGNAKWLEDEANRETTVKFIKALEEGWEMYHADPEPTIAAAMEFTGLNRPLIDKIVGGLEWYTLEEMLGTDSATSFADPANVDVGVGSVLKWIDETTLAGGLIEQSGDLGGFVDNRPASEAQK